MEIKNVSTKSVRAGSKSGIRTRIVFGSLIMVLWVCSAPEDENTGYCRLSCTETSLAASDYKFAKKISPGGFSCALDEVDAGVVGIAKWLVTAPIDRIGGAGGSAEVERSGIAFNVDFGGDPRFIDTTPAGNTDEPGHLGVITPQSEWCSDSCGLATVEVSGTCSADKDIDYSLILNSGAAVSEAMTWTHKKPEE